MPEITVLFEVTLKKEGRDSYLELAAQLAETLARQEGLLRAERFQSLADEQKLLSLSVWTSEEAVQSWRQELLHRAAQRQTRDRLVLDYRITVLTPLRQYGKDQRGEAPADANLFFGLEDGEHALSG